MDLQGNRTCQKAKLKLKIALPMPCGIASFVGGLSLILVGSNLMLRFMMVF